MPTTTMTSGRCRSTSSWPSCRRSAPFPPAIRWASGSFRYIPPSAPLGRSAAPSSCCFRGHAVSRPADLEVLPRPGVSDDDELERTMPDVLTSWNDSAAKSAIVDFVARVTTEGGTEYVRPADRIATFDNDGTLW